MIKLYRSTKTEYDKTVEISSYYIKKNTCWVNSVKLTNALMGIIPFYCFNSLIETMKNNYFLDWSVVSHNITVNMKTDYSHNSL